MTSKPPSLMIAIPGSGYINNYVFIDIVSMISTTVWAWKHKYGDDAQVRICGTNRKAIPDARNDLAKIALAEDMDWIFWLDDDMVPPPDLVMALHRWNAPMAAGLCVMRRFPLKTMTYVFKDTGNGAGRRPLHVSSNDWTGKVREADATGMACLLMKREVLEAVWAETNACPFQYAGGKYQTEDLYFFEVASMKGYKVLIDGDMVVGHAGLHIYKPDTIDSPQPNILQPQPKPSLITAP